MLIFQVWYGGCVTECKPNKIMVSLKKNNSSLFPQTVRYRCYFWKCNFPMNYNVCLSVCRSVGRSVGRSFVSLSVCLSVKKKLSEFLNVRIFGKCRLITSTYNPLSPFRYDRQLHFHWTLIVLVLFGIMISCL